jgi:hypothetical protein
MGAAAGAIGMGASLAGGILGAVGAEKTAAAQQQMYNYQAGIAQINSRIDLHNADYARNVGEIQARDYGIKAAQELGNIRSAQSASNIDVNSGSSADVRASQRTVAQMDLTQIRSNAAKTAYDFDVKSTMDLNQSTLDIMAGQNAKQAGDINAMSSIIGSVGSVSSKWLAGKQAGMFGGGDSGDGVGFVSGL